MLHSCHLLKVAVFTQSSENLHIFPDRLRQMLISGGKDMANIDFVLRFNKEFTQSLDCKSYSVTSSIYWYILGVTKFVKTTYLPSPSLGKVAIKFSKVFFQYNQYDDASCELGSVSSRLGRNTLSMHSSTVRI